MDPHSDPGHDVDSQVDLDLDLALDRVYDRHGEIVAARARRTRLALGSGLAAITIVAAAIVWQVGSSGDSASTVELAGTATSTEAPVAVAGKVEFRVPEGYRQVERTDGVFEMIGQQELAPAPSTTLDPDGAVLIDAARSERPATIASVTVTDRGEVVARFDCVAGANDRVARLAWVLDGAKVKVDATVEGDHSASGCDLDQPGASVILPGVAATVDPQSVIAATIR